MLHLVLPLLWCLLPVGEVAHGLRR